MEKENGMTIGQPDRREDWECYRGCTGYEEGIRKTGDAVFEELYRKMGDGEKILFSKYAILFAGMPYDYKAFRGVTAYIARKAAKMGLCYVMSPVIEFSMDVYNINVTDIEMALIKEKEEEKEEDDELVVLPVQEGTKVHQSESAGKHKREKNDEKKKRKRKKVEPFTNFATAAWREYSYKLREEEEREEIKAGLITLAISAIAFALLMACAALDGLVVL